MKTVLLPVKRLPSFKVCHYACRGCLALTQKHYLCAGYTIISCSAACARKHAKDLLAVESTPAVDPELQRVACAALLGTDGTIVVGVRHFDSFMRHQIAMLKQFNGGRWPVKSQGFVDQFGKYLTRQQALKIAKERGQIIRRCGGDEKRLYSENIY